MRGLILIIGVLIMTSCSFHSRQSQVENSKKEKEEKLAEQKAISTKANVDISTIKELTPLEKVLSKKINPKTFEQDMLLIENANIYEELTCRSFRYSYDLLRASGQQFLDMTYKKALDQAKEGSERAKRIESMSAYKTN